jgi:hypothetical protein
MIKVSIESFGNKRLTESLSEGDLHSLSVRDVVERLMAKAWAGEERQVANSIRNEMKSSGGYLTQVGTLDRNELVRFEPVRLDDGMNLLVQKPNLPNKEIRIAVLGDHKVG